MKYTGVFATDEERAEAQELAQTAYRTPVMRLSSNSPSFSETAWKRVNERCYEMALAHGLPEIQGYYGMDEKGEFLTAE